MDREISGSSQPGSSRPPHTAQVRVRYGETDQGGVVYHANYIPYFEIGRTELMRAELDMPYEALEREGGVLLLVVDMEAKFRRPAYYDDLLAIETRVAQVSGAKVRFAYRVLRTEKKELLCVGSTLLGAVSRETGRPCRLPASLRERLENYQQRCEAAEAE